MSYNYDGDFNKKYDEYKKAAEFAINEAFCNVNSNPKLLSAMKYSVFAGGKRIRPVLFFATLDALGFEYEKYGNFAAALEFIHTYSLIHDDLPTMDNDDFRRGKPTNHKVYGEAFAVLAGDALLNFAYETALSGVFDKRTFEAVKELASFSGCAGMVGGQAYDLQATEAEISVASLNKIDDLKTGKLITLPFTMASIIAGKCHYEDFSFLGKNLGRLFQYTDDLLDVTGTLNDIGKTPGKDYEQNKITAISTFGTDGTRKEIEKVFTSCIKTLKNIDNNLFFVDFFNYVKNRVE